MNPKVAHKVSFETLDFDIYTSNFQAICGNTIFPTDKYMVIHDEKNLLGLRPTRNNEVFAFKHQTAYLLGENLFHELYQTGGAKICYLNEQRNWTAVLIGEGGTPFQAKSNFFSLEASWFGLRELIDIGFRPSIGVINGFDYNDCMAFYLLVEPINPKGGKTSFPVLTLDSFKFSDTEQDTILMKQNEKDRIACAQEILFKKALDKFSLTLTDFISLYKKLSSWSSHPEELVAICLDVFNKNRNIESILADNQLWKELQNFTNRAESFFCSRNTLSAIIDFIIQSQEVDFSNFILERNKIEQIFVKKKSYQKMERVFGNMEPESSKFRKYVTSQLKDYKDLSSVLYRKVPIL